MSTNVNDNRHRSAKNPRKNQDKEFSSFMYQPSKNIYIYIYMNVLSKKYSAHEERFIEPHDAQ